MRSALVLALCVALSQPSEAADQIKGVVELFTSQGCSSCPPADAVIEDLAQQNRLAVLSLPVDYWDRLGWKDTYGSPAHSARQRAYASARGDRAVYTPQVVVNGIRHMNGADRDEIEDNLQRLQSSLSVAVGITRSNGALRVAVGAAPAGATAAGRAATVVLMQYFARREVAIGRGENAQRRVAYTNIVRDISAVGEWTGDAQTFEIPAPAADAADGAIVLLQTGTADAPGPIVGAAKLDFAPE
jgi:hypothetical protein